MRKVSKKQDLINREIAKIKSKREKICVFCGGPGDDFAHLLPRSTYPEHVSNPYNLEIACRTCHNLYDNNLEFRQNQIKIYNQIASFDVLAANKYFRLYDKE